MTTRKHLKRLVRRRAALTGESYASALRTVRRTRQEEPEMPTTDRVPTTHSAPTTVRAYCSFCGKPNTEVGRLVAGPDVHICDECVELSATVIASSGPDRPTDAILAQLPALAAGVAQREADLSRSVGLLRQRGTDWSAIAGALGLDEQEARRRFDPALE